MLINTNNVDDIKKYWLGCYVKFKETGDQVFDLTSVDGRYVYGTDSQGNEIGIDLVKGYDIDYVIPKKTVYQYGEHAALLERVPARMWKKGMNQQNTQFSILTDAGWQVVAFNLGMIEGFVNKPCYYSFQDAMTEFKKSEHLKSAAITPRISVRRNGSVFVDSVVVGKFTEHFKTLATKQLFVPEMKKVFSSVTIKAV